MTSAGITLKEPKEFQPIYEPGIDYGDAEAIEDLERRQFLVRDLGFKNATMKALTEQRRHKYRKRPMRIPEPLMQPKWPWENYFPCCLFKSFVPTGRSSVCIQHRMPQKIEVDSWSKLKIDSTVSWDTDLYQLSALVDPVSLTLAHFNSNVQLA